MTSKTTTAAIAAAFALGALGCGKKDDRSQGGSAAPPAGSGSAPAPNAVAPDAAAPDAAATPATPPSTAKLAVDVPFMTGEKTIKVEAQVPVGWKQRGQISTWDPPEQNLPYWHRSYEIVATCDGGCTPAELADRPDKYLEAIKAKRIKPRMTGDAAKDEATVAPVQELEHGDLPQGGKYALLRVEKPVGTKDDYPDLFVGTCVTRRPEDGFFVVTKIAAAPADEKTWWPVLVAACKATTIDPATPATP